ncbi:MAG: PDZ domain-containing protein [Dehalococcoidia bacterium]|nr:PDZ domain-containing protein [Dehalococcoidia bacterium]
MKRAPFWVFTLGAVAVVLTAAGCTSDAKETPAADVAAASIPAAPPAPAPEPAPLPPTAEELAKASVVTPVETPQAPAPAGREAITLESFAEVVARARPAVVGIAVVAQSIDPFFGLSTAVQTGTGVIIDAQGYILTNEHVIANAIRIEVATDDEQTFIAEVVGKDAMSDLAVIKITAPGPLHSLAFAPPDSYRPGDWVIAIGNALGLPGGPTVTVGVIGAVNRTIAVDDQVISDLVQTDASIHEGNSGGPLVDLEGRIVGINTILSLRGSAQGIGFAISSFTTAPVARALIENGRVPWAWLGLSVQELSPSKALELDLPVRKGIIVLGLTRGGPAHVAGILPGDVLLRLDDTPLASVRDIDALLRDRYQAGDTAAVFFLRNGQEQSVQVTFATAP